MFASWTSSTNGDENLIVIIRHIYVTSSTVYNIPFQWLTRWTLLLEQQYCRCCLVLVEHNSDPFLAIQSYGRLRAFRWLYGKQRHLPTAGCRIEVTLMEGEF